MPYCTKKMAKYMKDKGISTVSDDGSSAPSSAAGGHKKRKLRESPSAVSEYVAPSSPDNSSAKGSSASGSSASSSKSSGLSATASSRKSSATGSKASSSGSNQSSSPNSSPAGSSAKSSALSSSVPASSSKAASSGAGSPAASSAKSSAASSAKSSAASSAKSSAASSGASSSPGGSKPSAAGSKAFSSALPSSAAASGTKVSSTNSKVASKNVPKSQVSLGGTVADNETQMTFDEKKLLYIKGLLKSQVKHIETMSASISMEQDPKTADQYIIEEDKPLGEKPSSCQAMVKAYHKQYKDYFLLCKIYDCNTANIDPNHSLYLKILRHLGKKHPGVIQTWEIFSKGDRVFVLQEYSSYGSIEKHLGTRGGAVDEKMAKFLTKQLFMAMDYMGDMGISHRAITPAHIMVTHKDMIIKLTGFRNSVIYWNVEKEDINFLPCIPAAERPKEPNFQALEVYGDPEKEEFDPVSADIWSFGACVYYFLTRKYPFDSTKENPNVESEVIANIDAMNLSNHGKKFLKKTLSTFANVRIQFDHINEHKWIKNVNI